VIQSIPDAHKLGCHHIATAKGAGSEGTTAASAGFGGELKVWKAGSDGEWALYREVRPDEDKAQKNGDIWALALSADERYLACSSHDGKVRVWDLADMAIIQVYETAASRDGSFTMAVDLSQDGRFTACGHQNGSVYVFNNTTGRLIYSLAGETRPRAFPVPVPY